MPFPLRAARAAGGGLNEVDPGVDEKDLKSLLRRAPRVPPDLKATITLPDDVWVQIENMARRREALTYGRADPVITGTDLQEAEDLVKLVLMKLHHIHLDA
ncbi:hypothetical protein [Bradyrhizobium cosmicum]|uniref:hypothetical protein n=1 Tax=Bradyrhizobium cosmicum TaxID=1404864 RepID=UPI0028E8CBD5|nr:hypothetical protein [Bradyrhizobium cosmicum]